MSNSGADRTFVTSDRLHAARLVAERVASKRPDLTGSQCAEQAVRAVFGSWLQDWTASIKPSCLPLYFHLINRVENQLDLHRRPKQHAVEPVPPLPQGSSIILPLKKPVFAQAAMSLAA